MLHLKKNLIVILFIGCPATTFAEQVTIEIPNAGWGITFDAPPLSKKEEGFNESGDYEFRANSDRFNLSFFVEEPRGKGRTNRDCYNFYWSRASQIPEISIPTIITSETPTYVRVQYISIHKSMGQTFRQKSVHYYFSFNEKWVDVHISIIGPTSEDDKIFAAFDRSLAYASMQTEEDQKIAVRSYTVPKHGQLELNVPKGWREKLAQPPGDLPPTILFQPKTGNEFKFLITAMWKENPRVDLDDPASLRAMVEGMGSGQLSTAVESKLDVQELRGDGVIGYYYLLTDKAPKPGEYEYMVGGAVSVGELLLTVTILLNAKSPPELQMALDVLKSARHLKSTAGARCPPVLVSAFAAHPHRRVFGIADLILIEIIRWRCVSINPFL
jgi:hypothetical protein